MDRGLNPLFRPQSIALIGISRNKITLGREILKNLLDFEFHGKIFLINPNVDVINCMKTYSSVCDVPDHVDLAVIVTPRHLIMDIVDECGKKGVRGLVIISAGFKEIGAEGAELEGALVDRIRSYGIRMVGPNCMGVMNLHPSISMNATFSPVKPLVGNISFVSQSGALGAAIINYATQLGLGFSMFVSVGNKADVDVSDLLDYWKDDENTKMILLYMESFGNPSEFTRIARSITRHKPIIILKSGRTTAGARAALSHTGALAGMDLALDALIEQCGVLRVSSIDEMFEVANSFALQPLPPGNRVAIITNAGGPGIMAADACVSNGLDVVELSKRTRERLRKKLPFQAAITNPVDMIASANALSYRHVLRVILEDERVDAVIVIFVIPPVEMNPDEVAKTIAEVSYGYSKPVLCCFMGSEGMMSGAEALTRRGIPTYQFPESAANALAFMIKYRTWKEKPQGEVRTFDVKTDALKGMLENAKREGRERLTSDEVHTLLSSYGFRFPRSKSCGDVTEALSAAEDIGYPVVLKMDSRGVVHKSDFGGVVLDVRGERELKEGFSQIRRNYLDAVRSGALQPYEIDTRPDDTEESKGKKEGGDDIPAAECRITVQEMVRGGKEIIVGMSHDPVFGPLVMCGLGGIYVEILKDVAFRVHPITDLEASEMIRSLRGYPILLGARGEEGVDIDGIIEYILRLSQMISDFPVIDEIDVNPFITFANRTDFRAVDARIKIRMDS
jgi:acetyltransferase